MLSFNVLTKVGQITVQHAGQGGVTKLEVEGFAENKKLWARMCGTGHSHMLTHS